MHVLQEPTSLGVKGWLTEREGLSLCSVLWPTARPFIPGTLTQQTPPCQAAWPGPASEITWADAPSAPLESYLIPGRWAFHFLLK